MPRTAQDVVAQILDVFLHEHADYADTMQTSALRPYLEHVFGEVRQGVHRAKSDDELGSRSREFGIERKDLEALINLTAHAATDVA